MATTFTDQNFKEETQTGNVVIDMYADWCGPCKMMAPIYDELAAKHEGKVKMGKLNVDENNQTPEMFGVTGIPTIVFLKDGQPVGQVVGFQSKDALEGKLKEYFGV
ncbi:thioredoxin [Candidatus Peregrinibacteria bacterium CG_4_9_14_0_2_um_filter_53_11]|nr:MAG: thioredoxin [Candidatus Peregrinibacteria bacterium CG_4_9_14_0_2_um_filter_53_11]